MLTRHAANTVLLSKQQRWRRLQGVQESRCDHSLLHAHLVVIVQHDSAALYPATDEALCFGRLRCLGSRRAVDPLLAQGAAPLQRFQGVVACTGGPLSSYGQPGFILALDCCSLAKLVTGACIFLHATYFRRKQCSV